MADDHSIVPFGRQLSPSAISKWYISKCYTGFECEGRDSSDGLIWYQGCERVLRLLVRSFLDVFSKHFSIEIELARSEELTIFRIEVWLTIVGDIGGHDWEEKVILCETLESQVVNQSNCNSHPKIQSFRRYRYQRQYLSASCGLKIMRLKISVGAVVEFTSAHLQSLQVNGKPS